MKQTLKIAANLPEYVLIGLMIILFGDMVLGVFSRYVMGRAVFWVEEVGSYSLIWLTFIGGAIGVRRGSHFAMPILAERLLPRQRAVLHIIHSLLILLVGVVLIWFSLSLIRANASSVTPALRLSLAVIYFAPPVGGFLICLYALANIVASLQSLAGGEQVREPSH